MARYGSRQTILFVNEFAVDLWPTAALAAIAEEVVSLAREQALDVSIVFALRDPVFAGPPFVAFGHHVVPSPTSLTVDHLVDQAYSFGDLLLAFRFARVRELHRAAAAWDSLFAVIEPDLIVADTSPIVMLAARGRIPVIATGSGFAVPPTGLVLFPPLAEGATANLEEQLMLEATNAVLKARGASPLDHLPQLLDGEVRAVFSFPKLDPYAHFRPELALRPCRCFAPIPFPAAPSLFVHMEADHPFAGAVVRGIDRSGIAVVGHLPGPESVATAFLKAIGAELHENLPSQVQILSRASIVVGGDIWLAQAAYAAGRPQICLPTSLEARLFGARLQDLGCGIVLRQFSPGELASAVRELTLDPAYKRRAEEEPCAVSGQLPEKATIGIVARQCLELANL